MRTHLFFLLMATALAGTARADVVAPPPTTCPEGSTPNTCHYGPHCSALKCLTDSDCPGRVCKEILACPASILCGGMYSGLPDVRQASRDILTTACSDSGTCGDGKPCQPTLLCVSPGTASATKTAVATSTGATSGTNSGTRTVTQTRTSTSAVTGSLTSTGTLTATPTRTSTGTLTATSTRTGTATVTSPRTETVVTSATATGGGNTATIANTGTGTGTGGNNSTPDAGIARQTGVATSGTTDTGSARQTDVATSVAVGTGTASATATDGPDARLAKNGGCSCDLGGWSAAQALGPWLLAGVFGAMVLLFRRRRR
jgi:hypothetical protein